MERLPQEALRVLQVRKFKKILGWAFERSKFHRRLYQQAGLEPGDIKTFEDVARVPKVDKAMMQDIQRKEPFPYGEALCVPLEEVTEFHQTSGTTGTPIYQPDTWQDWEWWSEAWATLLYAQGYRRTDRIFIPFGYNIFVAFWAGHYAAEKMGCEVIPGGVLDTRARLLKIQELKASAMMATPTYVLAMADTARNQLGIDPVRDLTIRKITCAGEPGASIPSTKKLMEEAWGAKVFDHAGATEVGAWGFECLEQPGGIHVNEALFMVHLEDLVTGELIEESGRKGKIVISALDRMAQPCIRFDSKDVAQWADHPCSCGRTFRIFKGGIIGRADDITKIKGVLVAPSSIEEVVRSIDGLGHEFEVVVTRKGDLDDITLKIELRPEQEKNRRMILGQLQDQLRIKTNLGYHIEVLPYNSLPRYEVKANRFKDLRKKG